MSGVLRRLRAVPRLREDDERYRAWLSARARTAAEFDALRVEVAALRHRPRVSVITPVHNTDPVWLRRSIDSVLRQLYDNWELCLFDDGSTDPRTMEALNSLPADPRIHVARDDVNRGISAASNGAVALATGDYVGFLDHDDELAPDALAEIVRVLDRDPSIDVVYTDEDKVDGSGVRSQPHFKPDWSPDLLRSCMYVSHFTVIRRDLVTAVGGFRAPYGGSQDYDLMLRVAERTSRIAHVPRVLYSWRAVPASAAASRMAKPWAIDAGRRALEDMVHRGHADAEVLPAQAAGHFRVRYRIRGTPLVSILITSGGRSRRIGGREIDLLAHCVSRILRTAGECAFEVLVSHDAPVSPGATAALSAARHHLFPCPATGAANMAARLNEMAHRAGGDHLLVMHDDVAPEKEGWLEAMLEHSQREPVGAVGAFLLYPDGTIEHGGIALGVSGLAGHAFQGEPGWTLGHRANALDVRNCSAVSAACLMTRRDVFQEVGGFANGLGSGLYDIDFGMRLRRAGARTVVTPHARLRHLTVRCGLRGANPDEVARLRATWGDLLDTDPFYSPNFDRHSASFRPPPATRSPRR